MENIRKRLEELEKRLKEIEQAQKSADEDTAEIRQILDEIINTEAGAAGQALSGLRRIRDLLKKHEGGKGG